MKVTAVFSRLPMGQKELMPSHVLTPNRNGYMFDHVELHIGSDLRICWEGTGNLGVDEQLPPFIPNPDDECWMLTTIPISGLDGNSIIRKRKSMLRAGNVYSVEYREFIEIGAHENSAAMKSFTCATMVAYLLGYDDYYKCVPDTIWYRLLGIPA